jgi:hypothetical protein
LGKQSLVCDVWIKILTDCESLSIITIFFFPTTTLRKKWTNLFSENRKFLSPTLTFLFPDHDLAQKMDEFAIWKRNIPVSDSNVEVADRNFLIVHPNYSLFIFIQVLIVKINCSKYFLPVKGGNQLFYA